MPGYIVLPKPQLITRSHSTCAFEQCMPPSLNEEVCCKKKKLRFDFDMLEKGLLAQFLCISLSLLINDTYGQRLKFMALWKRCLPQFLEDITLHMPNVQFVVL